MVRLISLLSLAVAAVHAVEMVPVRENGMLRGPADDVEQHNRRLKWNLWTSLMSKYFVLL